MTRPYASKARLGGVSHYYIRGECWIGKLKDTKVTIKVMGATGTRKSSMITAAVIAMKKVKEVEE